MSTALWTHPNPSGAWLSNVGHRRLEIWERHPALEESEAEAVGQPLKSTAATDQSAGSLFHGFVGRYLVRIQAAPACYYSVRQ